MNPYSPMDPNLIPNPEPEDMDLRKTSSSMGAAMAALLICLVLGVFNFGFGPGWGSGLYVIGMLAQIIAAVVAAVYSARAGQGSFSVIAATLAIITLLLPFIQFFGFFHTR